jgi:hypothetical protein
MLGKIIKATSLKLNLVNDSVAGGTVTGPTGVSPYTGQYGLAVELGPDIIKYDPATGVLYGGIYMYVRTLATSTAAPARGTLAFWVVPTASILEDSYTVTADAQPSAAVPTLVAGVFINAITKGNSGFIQIGGRASVLFDSAVTAAAAGNYVSAKVTAAVASTADVGALAGIVTQSAAIGIAETAPVAGAISVVQLNSMFRRI